MLVDSAKLELYWLVPILLLFAIRSGKGASKNIFTVLLLLIYSSSVVSFTVSKSIEERKQLQQKHIAEKLAEERDPVAEYMFNGVQQEILKDSYFNYWN